jgi:hypothetical protein
MIPLLFGSKTGPDARVSDRDKRRGIIGPRAIERRPTSGLRLPRSLTRSPRDVPPRETEPSRNEERTVIDFALIPDILLTGQPPQQLI